MHNARDVIFDMQFCANMQHHVSETLLQESAIELELISLWS